MLLVKQSIYLKKKTYSYEGNVQLRICNSSTEYTHLSKLSVKRKTGKRIVSHLRTSFQNGTLTSYVENGSE